jgi:hypothetical protein
MATRMAVPASTARAVFEAFCAVMGEPAHTKPYVKQGMDREVWDTAGPVLCHDLEDRGTFGIAWEGWMDQCPPEIWRAIEAAVPGVFIENGGSWYVTIWPR